jgi:hypothetical protein
MRERPQDAAPQDRSSGGEVACLSDSFSALAKRLPAETRLYEFGERVNEIQGLSRIGQAEDMAERDLLGGHLSEGIGKASGAGESMAWRLGPLEKRGRRLEALIASNTHRSSGTGSGRRMGSILRVERRFCRAA